METVLPSRTSFCLVPFWMRCCMLEKGLQLIALLSYKLRQLLGAMDSSEGDGTGGSDAVEET
jgi:hypothetical protein